MSSADLLHKLASALVSLSNLPESPTQYSSPHSGTGPPSTPNLSANVRAAYLLYSCPFPGGSYCPPSLLPTCHINTCPSYAWTPHSWTSTGISSWFPVSNHPIAYPSTDSFMDTVTKAIYLSVLPWDSLCGQDKYNHISLKNNIVCNPKGKLCLAFLLHKSQWESDLAWPMPHELANGQAYPQPDMLFICQYNFFRGAVKPCMRLISENKYWIHFFALVSDL